MDEGYKNIKANNVFNTLTKYIPFLTPLLLDIVLEVPTRTIKTNKKETYNIHIRKEEKKGFLFADGMILYIGNLKNI